LTKWSDGSAELEQQLPAILVMFAKCAQKTRTRNTALQLAKEQKQREYDERRRAAREAERARHRAGVLRGFAEEHDGYVKVRRLLLACESDGPVSEDARAWLRAAQVAAGQMVTQLTALRTAAE